MPNELALTDEGIDWAQLIDDVADLVDIGELPEKVLVAMPYLMSGLSKTDVAKKVGVSRATLSDWISRYPQMRVAIEYGKELAQEYRMAQLEGQFIQALRVSEQILTTDLTASDEESPVNAKLLTAVGQHARFVIDKFLPTKKELSVTHEIGNTVLDARQDALAYIADVIASSRGGTEEEPIEVSYRVIDGNKHTEGPLLTPEGEPNYGTLGNIVLDDSGAAQCHDCGVFFKSLASHIRKTMGASISDYEFIYGLEPGTVVKVSS